ncbi:transglutaminase-like cysteine peptidase [Devosia ginsengisoli]|uniref:transglutaminase-like cysteine peptidase n=1 Tax=Devosia ginsengisoli TaxID=400770 RepID=UPI0026F29432|nr:transglutaminase-like cysteine peptidase [Devosia ginsengisoli]MCR6673272.1 transglutaminase-like cysteine peptidase [Devosia ginsengisoli]
MKRAISLAAALAFLCAPAALAAPPPIPFGFFCAAHPADCQPARASSIELTDEAMAILKSANRQVNRSIRPARDAADAWELNPASGDCEDYALSKRHLLLGAGIDAGALRIGIGEAVGETHAVLIVITDRGPLVLDNQIGAIRPLASSGFRLSWLSGANPMRWERGL